MFVYFSIVSSKWFISDSVKCQPENMFVGAFDIFDSFYHLLFET